MSQIAIKFTKVQNLQAQISTYLIYFSSYSPQDRTIWDMLSQGSKFYLKAGWDIPYIPKETHNNPEI